MTPATEFNFDAKKLGEEITNRRDLLWEMADLVHRIKGHITVGRWYIPSMTDSLRVWIAPSDLHQLRVELRTALGTWGDKLTGINNIVGDWIQVNYTSTTHPIEISVEEDAKTIDLSKYGMSGCSLQEHVPEYNFKEKWTISCPGRAKEPEGETNDE